MTTWWAMGGHGFFVWSAYGALALAVVIECLALRRARQASVERARALRASNRLRSTL